MKGFMKYYRNKYRINSLRLQGFDYSKDGAYFITICTRKREPFFGRIIKGKLQESEISKICRSCWLDLPKHYNNCILDEFIIMPDHVHGIIFLKNDNPVGAGFKPAPFKPAPGFRHQHDYRAGLKPAPTGDTILKPYSISEIIRGFKTFTAKMINEHDNTLGRKFWQTRFYDHIIRNDDELIRIRKYIVNNPKQWEND